MENIEKLKNIELVPVKSPVMLQPLRDVFVFFVFCTARGTLYNRRILISIKLHSLKTNKRTLLTL